MTVFLYLNEVEEGGGTEFPKLGLTVYPKRGRALIWPSVKDEDPDQPDPRTDHGALPVLKGVKYGKTVLSQTHLVKDVKQILTLGSLLFDVQVPMHGFISETLRIHSREDATN
jgi:prolyl 4-hydroxylase